MGGIVAASGIILLFMIIAILVGLFGSAISQYVLYLMPIVGVMLIVLAVLIILDINLNFGFLTFPVKKGMAFSKRTLDKLRGKEVSADSDAATMQTIEEGGYVGLFLYGVGYGAAAAGCMAPIVIALILLAASQGSFLGSLVVFLVFALAMAAMMVIFTYVVANTSQAGGSLFGWKPNPKTVKVLTSGLLMIVGVYIIAFFALGYL
jgi:cytochrome c biogenesis protein CcdA